MNLYHASLSSYEIDNVIEAKEETTFYHQVVS